MDNYFVNLYKNVLEYERQKFHVREESIRNAIKVMKEAYLPDPTWGSKSVLELCTTDYDNPAFRCAYLHKYATCYTGMVCHLLELALENSNETYVNFSRMQKLNLCSLGGGPGTDIVGVLSALANKNFYIDLWSATIIDVAVNWRITFLLILSELQNRKYGELRKIVEKLFVSDSYYLKADLLRNWDSEPLIEKNIGSADLVLMVKFISAAACDTYTENMVERVFHCLKPGAMVLFIDNAAGGFDKMMKTKALEVGLRSIYGPLRHYEYENSKFDIHRFGSKSQSKSKVVFEVYQKTRSRGLGFKLQSGRICAHAGVDYLPERSVGQRAYIKSLERSQQQNIDDTGFRFCDLIIRILIYLVIGVAIYYIYSS